MKYPELSAINSTPEQDLGLTIAFKLASSQQQTTAQTPGEFLVEAVLRDVLGAYGVQHVDTEIKSRRADAYEKAPKADQDAADAILHVDTVIVPPETTKKEKV